MSGIVSGLVLRQPVTAQFTSEVKFVAVIYADHAWQDGTHAYPSIPTVARESGYHERSVQRYVRVLEQMGMLIPDGKGPRGTISYKFPLIDGPDGSVRLDMQPKPGGGTQPPRQAATPGGDTDSGGTDSGGTGVTRIIKQSFKPKEEEGATPSKAELSADLQKALTDAGIYRSCWPDIVSRLASDWTEADVVALLNWMRLDHGKPGRFVARVREGTKAPGKFYPPPAAALDDELPDDEELPPDDILSAYVDPAAERAWIAVLSQLESEMPRASFSNFVRGSIPVHYENGLLRVKARNIYARDWLESRLQSTAQRLLTGILDCHVTVEFVSAETEPA